MRLQYLYWCLSYDDRTVAIGAWRNNRPGAALGNLLMQMVRVKGLVSHDCIGIDVLRQRGRLRDPHAPLDRDESRYSKANSLGRTWHGLLVHVIHNTTSMNNRLFSLHPALLPRHPHATTVVEMSSNIEIVYLQDFHYSADKYGTPDHNRHAGNSVGCDTEQSDLDSLRNSLSVSWEGTQQANLSGSHHLQICLIDPRIQASDDQ